MIRLAFLIAGLAFAISGCAEQSAVRLSADTVRIHTSTAPIYGALEAEKRGQVMAAEETIKAGFDRFLIVGGSNDFRRNTSTDPAGANAIDARQILGMAAKRPG